jgi:ABC-type Fe3+/spermidine/putrescine transport system ATPase subunit
VADFIGTTNLLAGIVERIDGEVALVRLADGERCLAPAAGRQPGDAVDISIRPEAIDLAATGDDADDEPRGAADGGAPRLLGHVAQSAYLGTSVSHQVQTDGGLVLAVVVPRSAGRRSPGDRVSLGWTPSSALVLARPATQEEERG